MNSSTFAKKVMVARPPFAVILRPTRSSAASYDMLNIFGTVAVGWMWAQMAKVSLAKIKSGEGNQDFYKRKLTLARYWMEREMPMTAGWLDRAKMGAEGYMELDAAAF